jgi:hypothetical protein
MPHPVHLVLQRFLAVDRLNATERATAATQVATGGRADLLPSEAPSPRSPQSSGVARSARRLRSDFSRAL